MIRVDGAFFKDEHGRTCILRGVNLGGSSKVPYTPDGASHLPESFFNHRQISFIGRPFPLEKADEHLARLKRWGLSCLRLLITWEAIEHAGPGKYDEEYLDYLVQVVIKAGEHGFRLFIDPHQDVWSRFSGGDGAPGWTLEMAGMDLARIVETGAAVVHCFSPSLPRMIWPTNYTKLAAATMFTLFFGGNDFAPRLRVEGEPVQEFLQRHYIQAVKQVAERLQGFSHVLGYDTLNEPSAGYIGWIDLTQPGGLPQKGATPSPLQSMALGAGIAQEVEIRELGLTGPRVLRRERLNAGGVSLWREGYDCPWRRHGVWDLDASGAPELLRPDHFCRVKGRKINFAQDYLKPFANRYARELRSVDAAAIIFFEGPVNEELPRWGLEDAPNIVNASHWYDGVTLFTKQFRRFLTVDPRTFKLVLGARRVRQLFAEQIGEIKALSESHLGGVPTLIGEFGIPFDLDKRRAYRTGDFSRQVQALDATFQALDANLVSGTLWNYTADNSNAWGDQWNEEDFSIFSRDQQADPEEIHSGGRALAAAVRPYAVATAGEPLRMGFDIKRRLFEFEFRHDSAVKAPTEIFVPNLHYPGGVQVELSDGSYALDRQAQILTVRHSLERPVHTVRLRPV